jgi:ElaA protein
MTTQAGNPEREHPAPARGASAGPWDPLPWHVDLRESVLVGEVLGVSPQVCRGRWPQLPAATAHGLARLRVDVLVAEAGCPYPELDDLDVHPGTEHLWVPDGDVPVACLRVVQGADGIPLVDRACARADLRRLGLTSALVVDLVARFGAGPLDASVARATIPFFLQHGFEVVGGPFATPAGPRLPMRRHPESPWRY